MMAWWKSVASPKYHQPNPFTIVSNSAISSAGQRRPFHLFHIFTDWYWYYRARLQWMIKATTTNPQTVCMATVCTGIYHTGIMQEQCPNRCAQIVFVPVHTHILLSFRWMMCIARFICSLVALAAFEWLPRSARDIGENHWFRLRNTHTHTRQQTYCMRKSKVNRVFGDHKINIWLII